MSGSTMRQPLVVGRRALAIAGVVVVAMAMCFGASSASAQTNHDFCVKANLAPYGHEGDRCWAPYANYLYDAGIVTYERAGCVDVGYNGQLLQSWSCAPAEGGTEIWFVNNEWVLRQPVIRNNNLSHYGLFTGFYNCVMDCG